MLMGTIVETSYFGNLTQVDEPKVLIIPTPYEYTTSYNKGTKNGPQAILNGSKYIELFDDELWTDVSQIGINTSNFINCEFVTNKSKSPFLEIEEAVRTSVINGCLPVVIGGESNLTYGSLKAINNLYPDVSVLHFSARSDLKDSLQNNRYNHSCTTRRIYEAMPDLKIVQLGIRAISSDEKDWLEKNEMNIEIFWAKEKNIWNMTEILSSLKKNVYVSFDFDVLDPSIMPSTNSPEPNGLMWDQVTNIIKNVCAFKDIVGMDFVGLSPIPGLVAPDFLAAKLIYKLIAYTFARQLGAFEDNNSELVTSES